MMVLSSTNFTGEDSIIIFIIIITVTVITINLSLLLLIQNRQKSQLREPDTKSPKALNGKPGHKEIAKYARIYNNDVLVKHYIPRSIHD